MVNLQCELMTFQCLVQKSEVCVLHRNHGLCYGVSAECCSMGVTHTNWNL